MASTFSLPLKGIRIIDLGLVWSGPVATRMLADMGAEVIHVESCRYLDASRYINTADSRAGERPWERGLAVAFNRNKYGLTLDLSKPEGADIFRRLVKISDVVLENFSPRVMRNLGLEYSALKQVRPDLIMISLSAYGQDGPYKDFVGYGVSVESTAGTVEMAGYPDRPPILVDSNLSDVTAAFLGAAAVMAALHYRRRSRKGQYIDLSEREAMMGLIGGQIMDFSMNARRHSRMGNRHLTMAPHGCYRCKGEDQWVVITVSSDDEWKALCSVMGNPEWAAQEKFSDVIGRWENQDELDTHIEEWTSARDHYDVMQRLQQAGVAAGAVLSVKEIFMDTHLNERGFFSVDNHPEIGRRRALGMPFRLSKMSWQMRNSSPTLGQHNYFVLHDLLGMTKEEITHLEERQVIGTTPLSDLPPDVTPPSVWEGQRLAKFDPDYAKSSDVQ